jgi:hypothetical protein
MPAPSTKPTGTAWPTDELDRIFRDTYRRQISEDAFDGAFDKALKILRTCSRERSIATKRSPARRVDDFAASPRYGRTVVRFVKFASPSTCSSYGKGRAKVLSNPSLVVINNQVATLQVGDVVPVSTGSATVLTTNNTVVNTIDYRNTGIILRVSPRINVNGNVRLEVEQEISNVSPTTASSLTPTVSERKVKSSVSVATGQTVLLAGLISEQQNRGRNGIPLLDQIPGLGDAFSNQDTKNTRTELIIFIRPQIIRDGTDAHFVAEELRSKLRGNIDANLVNGPGGRGVH